VASPTVATKVRLGEDVREARRADPPGPMAEPPAAAPPPCCVCDAPGGKHCTACKSRHYCSKTCQLVDWKRGHSKACRKLAAEFRNRLRTPVPEKAPREAPAIVEDVLRADGANAAPRLSAVQAASALSDDAPSWRDTCAICLDALPLEGQKTFYTCCAQSICTVCHVKCIQHDERCPLCRALAPTSAEWLPRLQKHVDRGNAEAQVMLGTEYFRGGMGLQQNFKRAVQLLQLAAAQRQAVAQNNLGSCYAKGQGVKIDHKTAALWYRRAAEQGYHLAQCNLGMSSFNGEGVAQSYEEAVRWWRLAAAQDNPQALYNLGTCHANGHGVPQNGRETFGLFKRAAAKGHAGAAAAVAELLPFLPPTRAA
jgi:TPR repeat protein